jgi:predicted RNase H-like nuclease
MVGVVRPRTLEFCEFFGFAHFGSETSRSASHLLKAETVIHAWQAEQCPTATLVLLDQPTIVSNAVGQRSVENIVGSLVGLRYGGMQPANTARADMFGKEAPMWPFLTRFGGPADPLEAVNSRPIPCL